MHRCLAIDEVLCDILWQVDDKGSLYHAALVCRAFLEPANKSLWYHLQNLYHLVNLLPAHLLEDYDYRLTILSPPSPADWRRFTHHGRYVKFLEIWGWEAGGCFIDENAFKIIAEHHPGPFLPNLMHLSWSDRGLVEYAPLVMPPTLITLRSVGYIPLAGILDRVVTNTPRLKRLTFCDDSSEILDGDELADAIKAHDQWTTLEEVVLRSDAFVHLSRIPHLTTLSVALTEDDHDCGNHTTLWGGFPALETLTLLRSYCMRNMSPSPMMSLLEGLSGSSLTFLEVNLSMSLDSAEFDQFTQAMGHLQKLKT